jgi:hypothetical protein
MLESEILRAVVRGSPQVQRRGCSHAMGPVADVVYFDTALTGPAVRCSSRRVFLR